jgi:DNA (cytosine-5)-methyltransferase 1
MKHTFGELFAGVGGFGMGMEAAGWTCAWQVEWDKQCQQVLRHHWPDVPKYGDVSTVSGYDLAPVDCITFGSPCQDLSVAGKRAGLDGNRSGLFFEAVRIIKEMRDATKSVYPRWAIWENVVGALSSNHGHDFAAVLDSLAEAGAVAIEWAVLDAQHFGIPQRRRRVFVIACFDPATAARCPDSLLPVAESLRRDTPAKRTKGQGVTGALTRGLGTGGPDFAHADAGWLVPEVVNDPTDDVSAPMAFTAKGNGEAWVHEMATGLGGGGGQPGQGYAAVILPVGAYVVNAPTDDVVFPIQDGRGMEKMQNGFGKRAGRLQRITHTRATGW